MPATKLTDNNSNITTWEVTPAEMRAALASIGIPIPSTSTWGAEGDDIYMTQAGATVGAQDDHGNTVVTVVEKTVA